MQSKHLTPFKTKKCMTTDSYMQIFFPVHTHTSTPQTHTHTFVWDILSDSHRSFADEKRPNLNSDILTLNLRFMLLHPYVCAWRIVHSCLTLCNPVDRSLQRLPLSMEFFKWEVWSGLPFLPPGSSRPRDQAQVSYVSQADSLPSESPEKRITAMYHKLTFYGRRKMVLIQLMISVKSGASPGLSGIPCP